MANSGRKAFDWTEFGKWMDGQMSALPKNGGFHWISDYVDRMMKEAVSLQEQKGFRPKRPSKPLREETFETHHYVIVRLHVPVFVNERRLRVHASAQRLKIAGLPGDEEQVVALPFPVSPSSARAMYKDGILQVKLLKRKITERFEEIYIRYR